ncbi:GIY-YIG nuclease family protein [Paenisporosarcina cavernae]|uniref:GIY-YIG nuclease family protein n=1 Tax=Paenisporosarcina cavernae TaxID=2320858 RepID=A0A385YW66_9BACL|nr:GIY-YIG nuclease family protein [Paenisporosarcina cavernae]AYC30711.1 GIY-YIG nuclease family protein [Paenisporosarcina cavernae]
MEKAKCYYFYVLKCSDGTFYAGYTNDVHRRLSVHNDGKGAKYTRARLPVTCIYYEEFNDKKQALRAERQFKKLTRTQKITYMKGGVSRDSIAKKL